MSALIRHEGGAHWYDRDGNPSHDSDLRDARKQLLYTSATTVEKDAFKNDFLDKWVKEQILLAAGENPRMPHENTKQYAQRIYDLAMEKSRKAREFGTRLHDAMEKHPEAPSDDELMPWMHEFSQWWIENRIEPISREDTVTDHDIGVAGRMDLKAMFQGELSIVDYKTQDVKMDDKGRKKPVFYDSWLRQLTFYSATDQKKEIGVPRLLKLVSAIIDSNPGGKVYYKVWDRAEAVDAYNTFLHGAWLWFDKRGYWPVGKWHVNAPGDGRKINLLL